MAQQREHCCVLPFGASRIVCDLACSLEIKTPFLELDWKVCLRHQTLTYRQGMILQLFLLLTGGLVQASSTLCDQFQAVESNSYLIQTNQWGADGSGYQCLTVPDQIPLASTGATFSTTWQWHARQELVHAFPHFGVQHDIPTVLSNLTSLDSSVTWSYSADASITTDPIPPSFDVRANVAFDVSHISGSLRPR